jgi:hypothetical protein
VSWGATSNFSLSNPASVVFAAAAARSGPRGTVGYAPISAEAGAECFGRR